MFNNVGRIIRIIAMVFAIIVVVLLILCIISGALLLMSGHGDEINLKLILLGMVGMALIFFCSLLLFGFGEIIEMNEEQTLLLRKIAEDQVTSYEKNNNVFVE